MYGHVGWPILCFLSMREKDRALKRCDASPRVVRLRPRPGPSASGWGAHSLEVMHRILDKLSEELILKPSLPYDAGARGGETSTNHVSNTNSAMVKNVPGSITQKHVCQSDRPLIVTSVRRVSCYLMRSRLSADACVHPSLPDPWLLCLTRTLRTPNCCAVGAPQVLQPRHSEDATEYATL